MNKEIYGYVYIIKNKINSKMYFGVTVNNFRQRYGADIINHVSNEHLKRSIMKYGVENFEINEEFDIAYTKDDLFDLEDMYMCIYNTLDPRYGYNKKRSGAKYGGAGRPNEEVCKKISNAKKGVKYSEETKQLWSEQRKGEGNPNYGKHWDDEHKKKISESVSKAITGEGNPMYGKKHTEEAKRRMSEKAKGRKASKETKVKMSEKRQGKDNGNAKKVVCLETNEIFDTIGEAKQWSKAAAIGQCCLGKVKYSGKHPETGEKLHWMYYEDWLKLQENN